MGLIMWGCSKMESTKLNFDPRGKSVPKITFSKILSNLNLWKSFGLGRKTRKLLKGVKCPSFRAVTSNICPGDEVPFSKYGPGYGQFFAWVLVHLLDCHRHMHTK